MTTLVSAFALGVLTWTLLEYCLHRWLGHDARTRPNPFADEHIRHHSQGDYFAPAWKKSIVTMGVTLLVVPTSVFLLGRSIGLAYSVGLVGFYLTYEVLHRLEHVWAGVGPYARWARRHHFWHHYGDPSKNHGVTSPIWDFVFGTYETPGVIVVPEKLCMTWLKDPQSGEVRERHAADYRIRPAKTRAAEAIAA